MIVDAPVFRRCRPLLGTFVDIAAHPPAPWPGGGIADGAAADAAVARAVEGAFAAVARIHDLMSPHQAGSDLSRLNRAPVGKWVEVAPETAEVLRLAERVFRATGGLFDPATGGMLRAWGLLPGAAGDEGGEAPLGAPGSAAPADGPAFAVADDGRARLLRPAFLDLGGIAKGFAVDAAAEALATGAVAHATVNAGGDLRFLGDAPRAVHLRDPAQPGLLHPLEGISHAAVATSCACFSAADHAGRRVNALVHPHTGMPAPEGVGVTVLADSCAMADALTKPVLFAPPEAAHGFLRAFGAIALVLGPGSQARWIGHEP